MKLAIIMALISATDAINIKFIKEAPFENMEVPENLKLHPKLEP